MRQSAPLYRARPAATGSGSRSSDPDEGRGGRRAASIRSLHGEGCCIETFLADPRVLQERRPGSMAAAQQCGERYVVRTVHAMLRAPHGGAALTERALLGEQGAAAPMFPFEDAGDGAGWDDYGGPVRPGDFGAAGLPAGVPCTPPVSLTVEVWDPSVSLSGSSRWAVSDTRGRAARAHARHPCGGRQTRRARRTPACQGRPRRTWTRTGPAATLSRPRRRSRPQRRARAARACKLHGHVQPSEGPLHLTCTCMPALGPRHARPASPAIWWPAPPQRPLAGSAIA